MIWLLLILLMLTLFITYFLFAPFYLEIDSKRKLIRMRFHRLASARLLVVNSSLMIDVRIPGWRKSIDLIRQDRQKIKATTKKKYKARKIPFHKIKAVMKSFKVNRCYVDVDLDNMEMNGMLFPLFYWVSHLTGKYFRTNFLGRSDVSLEIENNVARMLWAYIFN